MQSWNQNELDPVFSEFILITGMPRSGTSWLSQIFDSSPQVCFRLSPLFSYEFKNQADETTNKDDWTRILRGAYRSQSEFMHQQIRREQGTYPTFPQKSSSPRWLVIKDTRFHNLTERLLVLFDNIKVIALIRNPCGAINSWLQSSNEFPENADATNEWRSGACRKTGDGEYWGFDDWKKVTQMHLRLEREFPLNFKIQKYERLVSAAETSVTELFQFCGVPMSEQTLSFVARSQREHNPDQYAGFKHPSVSKKWKAELPAEIQNTIYKEISGTELSRFWT